ncbi:MAG: hypothetical protein DRH11_07600 [Deltaproteobacteria bacterium]|nr:MAG: hypothetical protein DRH11_07600 [Deltaproteobacteria bacterium]
MSRKPDRLDQILSEARLCEWLNLPLKERSRRSQTITYWIKAGLPCIEKSGYRFFIEGDVIDFLWKEYERDQ